MAAEIGTSYKEPYVFRTELVYPEDAARIEARMAFQNDYEIRRDVELRHIKPSIERRRVTMVPPYGPEHFPRGGAADGGPGPERLCRLYPMRAVGQCAAERSDRKDRTRRAPILSARGQGQGRPAVRPALLVLGGDAGDRRDPSGGVLRP